MKNLKAIVAQDRPEPESPAGLDVLSTRQDDTMVPHSKREMVIRRIQYTVTQYFEAHGPMPIQILSAKYSRLCKDIGGFPELMMELEDHGLIDVEVTKTGRQLVSPGKKKRIPKPLF